eukprot:m.216820 g.216820  ORF g.216820 m.216820 type:complete len:56 (-) comp25662_c0_seq1:921-1088(-)
MPSFQTHHTHTHTHTAAAAHVPTEPPTVIPNEAVGSPSTASLSTSGSSSPLLLAR